MLNNSTTYTTGGTIQAPMPAPSITERINDIMGRMTKMEERLAKIRSHFFELGDVNSPEKTPATLDAMLAIIQDKSGRVCRDLYDLSLRLGIQDEEEPGR